MNQLSCTKYLEKRFDTKIPEITLYFWLNKLLTTAIAGTSSDYIIYHMNPYIALMLGGIGFVASLILQFVVRQYFAWIYWLRVVIVAGLATMVADVTHILLEVPYHVLSLAFASILVAVFIIWYKVENTLSICSVNTRRRELFYWASVLTTFALGTAIGHGTAMTLHIDQFDSWVLFTGLFLLPGLSIWLFGLNKIIGFWFSYIMIRPSGASFTDCIGLLQGASGLGVDRGWVSTGLIVFMIIFVTYLTMTRKDISSETQKRRRINQFIRL